LLYGCKKELKSLPLSAAGSKPLSQRLVRQRLLATYEAALDDAMGLKEVEASKIVRAMAGTKDDRSFESVDDEFTKGVLAVVRVLFGRIGRRFLAKQAEQIKTEEDLNRRINDIRRDTYTLPSDFRKILKKFMEQLPRRGGPGRKPKLSPQEEAVACDQVLVFVRNGMGIKAALKRTADNSPTLLGKPVGMRTLQKVWQRRNAIAKTE